MYIPLTFEGSQAKCLFASGGYEGYFISGSQQYKYHWFTGSANLEVQKGTIDNVQIYVVGGAGGGGKRSTAGGGGGGGGVNYDMNARLFQGTYNVSVGAGGLGTTITNTNGFNGIASSFIGSNLSMTATGGGGGRGLDSSAGGTGGTPNGGNGGNGGTTPQDGFPGITIYLAEIGLGFGCGGGGAKTSSGVGGLTCNGGDYGRGAGGGGDAQEGAEFYGMGGGGGNSGRESKKGASGSVIIQYPIYDYCSNYFNETGSCDCREITFDITDPLNFYPQYTGSYVYTPCGTNTFASGSLKPYYPKTVCAASGSWFWVQGNSGYGNSTSTVSSAFPECFSASYGVQTCVTQSFAPTCNSNLYTFSNSGSGASTIYWVPRNSGNVSYSNLAAGAVTYQCVSTGSFGLIGSYPYGGSARVFTTASCSNTTFTAVWNGVGPTVAFAAMKYMQCNGTISELVLERGATSGVTTRSASVCVDRTVTPTTRYGGGFPIPSMVVSYYESCLDSYIDTGSCGCVSGIYSVIQNCSSSVTSSATFSGSYYPETGFTFTANTTGLSGSCWNVIGTASFDTLPKYSNVITQSIYTNCTDCEIARIGSGSVSWSFTENSQDGLFTIYDNANTITTLSGSGTGNNVIVTGHYVTASLTPTNYPTSGAVVMTIYANGNSVTQSIGSSANTTITSSFLVPNGSRTSITASITYYPSGIEGAKSYVFLAGPAGGTATYRLAGATTNTSTTLSSGSSIQVCAYTNSVSISGTDSKQFAGPVCGNVITASCDCYSASFTAGVLPPYAVQYIPCSSSVFSYVLLDFPQTFSGCISYPSSSLATAGQSGSPTSSLSLSGSCKSGNCP